MLAQERRFGSSVAMALSNPRSRRGWTSVATVALLVSVAASYALARGSSSGEDAASTVRKPLPALYVAPGGSDAARCLRESPCASFDRAYRSARPGQVVVVRGGTYPPQTIEPKPLKRAGGNVVFRPARGARVRIEGALVVQASRIEIRDMAASRFESVAGDRQTFRNLDVDLFYIKGSSNVAVIGGDVGPHANDDSQVKSYEGRVPTGILIDGVYFHDAVKSDPKAHTECLQFGSGIDVVVRRSRFERCANHDIFIRSWGTANGTAHPLRGFTIENNFFGKTVNGYYSLRLAALPGWPCEDFLIRNNSALQNMYSDCEARNVRFLANIQPSKSRYGCTRSYGAVWDWNVYGEGAPCGPHDVVRRVVFRDAEALDLHLAPRAAARGRGAPGNVPATDIDGERRPTGKPDAGADEL